MLYQSTRGGETVEAAQAIAQGIAADGGLFAPETLPAVTPGEMESFAAKGYIPAAECILRKYLTGYTDAELKSAVRSAYREDAFPDGPAVLKELTEDAAVLELWHGPTFAFKDVALQLLPHLLTLAGGKTSEQKKEIVILAATSGDTGKAALEGFAGVPGTKIIVFYPQAGVSVVQERQMTTQKGDNVAVLAVKGNFDDAQAGVKRIFNDRRLAGRLEENGLFFSSANSINWGRLAPQIVYYFYAYALAVKNGRVKAGEKVDFAVPTGNFGNILAGFYALGMGLPVGRFICASNANNVLADFINTGRYDRKRAFHKTISPSMDILVSSNLERLLYHLTGKDAPAVSGWMKLLARDGCYDIGAENKKTLQKYFSGYWVDDGATQKTIAETFARHKYLMDTHTAVAWKACADHRRQTGGAGYTIVLSTASPFKFALPVLKALNPDAPDMDAFAAIEGLSELSGLKIPEAMRELGHLPVLHDKAVAVEQMTGAVRDVLAI
ncbi:MAG: threonine synthase [Acidaminococcales bacterium]|jgi:threonine synthase|nr:threonine synthase [Acidaminococcales bacterium]